MTDRFAPVAPVAVHQRMLEAGVLGGYHLLLAHQVLKQPAIHEAFYKGQLLPRHETPYIIMDNSLIELGYPLPVADVLAAGELVNANVIVLPDVLGDRIKTLEASAKAMEELDRLRATSPYAGKVKAIGVAQGQNFNDVFSCARDLIQILGVEAISIPRHVTMKQGTRIQLVRAITQYKKPIHLLGFSNNLFDDFYCLRIPGVMGIDSAVPIWYGLQGFNLPVEPPVMGDFGKRPTDYEHQIEINSNVIQNMRRVSRWVSVAEQVRRGN